MKVSLPAIFIVIIAGGLSIAPPGAYCGDFVYDQHGRRDPFVPLVEHEKRAVLKLEDITSIEDVKLEGIVRDAGGRKEAIINGELSKENSKFGEVKVLSITNKRVTISIGGKSYDIKLPEEGGQTVEQ